MAAADLLDRWGFACVVAGLAAVASWGALSTGYEAQPVRLAPLRVANVPSPGTLEGAVRDPFMTGAEWRTRLREGAEPQGGAQDRSSRPNPEASGPVLLGTMITDAGRYAVTPGGLVPVGGVVDGHRVVSVDVDRVVFSRGGRQLVVTVQSAASPSPAQSPGASGEPVQPTSGP